MEYRIDQRYVYPVSEECLCLALEVMDTFSIDPKTRMLAEKIVQVYIINQALKEERDTITTEEITEKFGHLIMDHVNNKLVNKGILDVCFENNQFLFSLTEMGKMVFNNMRPGNGTL